EAARVGRPAIFQPGQRLAVQMEHDALNDPDAALLRVEHAPDAPEAAPQAHQQRGVLALENLDAPRAKPACERAAAATAPGGETEDGARRGVGDRARPGARRRRMRPRAIPLEASPGADDQPARFEHSSSLFGWRPAQASGAPLVTSY